MLIADLVKDYVDGKESVIDIGCGTGKHIFPFKELGFKSFMGIDIEPLKGRSTFMQYLIYNYPNNLGEIPNKDKVGDSLPLVDRNGNIRHFLKNEFFEKESPTLAKTIKREYGVNNWIFDESLGRIESKEFAATKKYDLVVVSDVLHFVSGNDEQIAINNILRCLKSDGFCFIAVSTTDKIKADKKNPANNPNQYEWLNKFHIKHVFDEKIEDRYFYTKDRLMNLISKFKNKGYKQLPLCSEYNSPTSEAIIFGPDEN